MCTAVADTCLSSPSITGANGIAGVAACLYRSADKSLARPGRKQATAIEDFDVHISYL